MSATWMSVVVVTDQYETIRLLMGRLREQTARNQIEVVIVAPVTARLELDESDGNGFARVRVVEVDTIHPMSDARAAGVRAATAPVVFLGETHSFPHPGFAAALIAAHEKPWDIVVPGIGNANPDGALSWAAFLMDYGQWHEDLPAGEISGGPTWNTSYKRSALLDAGERLGMALSSSDELSLMLRASGRRAYFEPAAKIDHTNVSRRGWTDERYLSGLLIGAHRRGMWSPGRRLLYMCASPLILAVILSRIARSVRVASRNGGLPRGTVPAIVLGAIVRTVGEVVGYAVGAAPAAEARMGDYELNKLRYTATPLTAATIGR